MKETDSIYFCDNVKLSYVLGKTTHKRTVALTWVASEITEDIAPYLQQHHLIYATGLDKEKLKEIKQLKAILNGNIKLIS